jgi:hypothetical protein
MLRITDETESTSDQCQDRVNVLSNDNLEVPGNISAGSTNNADDLTATPATDTASEGDLD